MLLLPIPVAHPPNKKNPAHRPDYFLWWSRLLRVAKWQTEIKLDSRHRNEKDLANGEVF
jgi:hypothetical protein